MRALQIAATGMAAQQMRVEVISNNLANMNTAGFRREGLAFTEFVVSSEVGESVSMAVHRQVVERVIHLPTAP